MSSLTIEGSGNRRIWRHKSTPCGTLWVTLLSQHLHFTFFHLERRKKFDTLSPSPMKPIYIPTIPNIEIIIKNSDSFDQENDNRVVRRQ